MTTDRHGRRLWTQAEIEAAPMPALKDVQLCIDACSACLAGHPPQFQGMVIADLLAIFIACHHPAEIRAATMDELLEAADALVAHYDAEGTFKP